MNAFNKFSTAIYSVAVIASVLAVSSAYKAPVSGEINSNSNKAMPTVTIAAKRLNADEKLAYDLQSASGIQTVMISAKRMNTEQKLAVDRDTLAQRQAAAKYAKTIQQSV